MSDSFSRIWNAKSFAVDEDAWPDLRGPCPYAVAFQAWVDVLFDKHLEAADLVRVHQLLLQVQQRWHDLHARLPEAHRREEGREPDHHCVFTVYKAALATLYERRDDLAPPLIIESEARPAKPKKPRTRLDGLLFGDAIDDEDADPEFGP